MRQYVIFNSNEINQVDFNQTIESNKDTLRYDINNEMTFVKWEGTEPAFVANLTTKIGIFNQTAMEQQLAGAIWQTGVVPSQS